MIPRARATDLGFPFSGTPGPLRDRNGIGASYNGEVLDLTEGERIAHGTKGADIAFLADRGVIVCGESVDYAFDNLYYLERACQVQLLAAMSGLVLAPVAAEIPERTTAQPRGDRQKSVLFLESLPRRLPEPGGKD